MNKKDVINALKKELSLSDDKIKKINDIFENNFLVGKNNKKNIIDELMNKLSIDKTTADKIYNKFMDIVGSGIKDKIINIFKK